MRKILFRIYVAMQHHRCSSWRALITLTETVPSTFLSFVPGVCTLYFCHSYQMLQAFLFIYHFFVIVMMMVFQTHLSCNDWHSLSHVFAGETCFSHFPSAFTCLLISDSLNLHRIITDLFTHLCTYFMQ